MSKVDVALSNLSTETEDYGVFHDFRYTNDRSGGNQNEMMFEVRNETGNGIFVEGCLSEYDEKTRKWSSDWYDLTSGRPLDGVRIHITGGIENSEFLHMLRLILEAEKMVSIIKP